MPTKLNVLIPFVVVKFYMPDTTVGNWFKALGFTLVGVPMIVTAKVMFTFGQTSEVIVGVELVTCDFTKSPVIRNAVDKIIFFIVIVFKVFLNVFVNQYLLEMHFVLFCS